jgi:predicted 3-demethylubiquinone-9 3-methyltransferase (glyoxalase superfamily)
MSSIEDFSYAIQHGYIVYDLSIYYLVKNRAPTDVLFHAIALNNNRVPVCAIVEAWTQDRFELQKQLFARVSHEAQTQAETWIADLKRKNQKYIKI